MVGHADAAELLRGYVSVIVASDPSGDVRVEIVRSPEEADTALDLAEEVWGTRPITDPMLRALQLAGSYLAIARRGQALMGMCAGIVGMRDGHAHLHSHLLAVRAEHRGRGVGRALKWHQRAWCLEQGIERVSWTFDPLVRANARFNLHHLGADIDRYLVDLYGSMDDDINRGDPSDRLLVRWDLRRERVVAAASEPVRPVDADAAAGRDAVFVSTPDDITALRRDAPDEAARWRHDVRRALTSAFDDGRRVAGLTADGRYVLERP